MDTPVKPEYDTFFGRDSITFCTITPVVMVVTYSKLQIIQDKET